MTASRKYFAGIRGTRLLGASVLAASLFAADGAFAQQFYRLESAVPLKSAASPDWDYITLDPSSGNLFIGQRGSGASVYDINGKKFVRMLDKSDDAGSITLVPEFNRGYTTNGDGTTTIFDLKTLATIDRVKFGEDADNLFYDPVTKKLVGMMGDSQSLAFMDAKTGKVLGTIKAESKKLDGSAPDGHGNMFVAERDRNSILRVDVANQKLLGEWKTEGCDEPTGLAFDSANKRLFIGCRGKNPVLGVMDSETGKMVTTLEIGRGNDGVVYDPDTKKIYTSNGVEANLVIYDQVDANTYKLSQAVTTRPYARTMALDPKTKKVYLVTAEGTVDPSKKQNKGPAPFYPNKYFSDTFTLLTYSPK